MVDVVALPCPSSFTPRVRLVAWSDSESIRTRFVFGSQNCLIPQPALSRPPSSSSRPSSVHYRPKSGSSTASSRRPYSAPMGPKEGPPQQAQSAVSVLNISLPSNISPSGSPMYQLQPRIPPKKQSAQNPWISRTINNPTTSRSQVSI